METSIYGLFDLYILSIEETEGRVTLTSGHLCVRLSLEIALVFLFGHLCGAEFIFSHAPESRLVIADSIFKLAFLKPFIQTAGYAN